MERERNKNLPNTNDDGFCVVHRIRSLDVTNFCEELEETEATRISIRHFIDRTFGQSECGVFSVDYTLASYCRMWRNNAQYLCQIVVQIQPDDMKERLVSLLFGLHTGD